MSSRYGWAKCPFCMRRQKVIGSLRLTVHGRCEGSHLPVPITAVSFGPPPLQPCGTHAAFVRHKAAGEQPCEECWEAERTYQRRQKADIRRRARAAA